MYDDQHFYPHRAAPKPLSLRHADDEEHVDIRYPSSSVLVERWKEGGGEARGGERRGRGGRTCSPTLLTAATAEVGTKGTAWPIAWMASVIQKGTSELFEG